MSGKPFLSLLLFFMVTAGASAHLDDGQDIRRGDLLLDVGYAPG